MLGFYKWLAIKESENKNKPEHLLVQTVREKKYPNGPELPSFGRKNIFLNNLFYN